MTILNSYFLTYKNRAKFWLFLALAGLLGFLIVSKIFPEFGLSSEKTARLEIEINDQKRAFEGEVVGGMTVLDALQASVLAGNISFQYKPTNNGGLIINSLNGYNADKNARPILFYLNSVSVAAEKIGSTTISPGDTIIIVAE